MDPQIIDSQLRREKEILERGLEGMKVFMLKLRTAAEAMAQEYDKCDLTTQEGVVKAIRIQMYRDIVTKELPRMMENIMNVDREPEHRFSFFKWLRSTLR